MSAGLVDANGMPHAFEELRDPAYQHDPKAWWGLPRGAVMAIVPKPHTRTSEATATELSGDLQQAILRRRHPDTYEDAREMLWMAWGSAMHVLHEQNALPGTSEVTYRATVDGVLVGCRADAIEDRCIWDYKTTSVFKAQRIAKGGFEAAPEWYDQLRLTAAIAYVADGVPTLRVGLVIYCRDWRPGEATRSTTYPAKQFPVSTEIEISECVDLLHQRVAAWKEASALPDSALPPCEDLYQPLPDGRPSRCIKYCDVRSHCGQYRSRWGA